MKIAIPDGRLFVNGDWRESSDGTVFRTINPATEEPIVEVQAATEADVDAAVAGARAQVDDGAWAKLSGADRGRLLWRLADLLERDLDQVAALESLDVGKPYPEPQNVDIPFAVETFRHFAGWADKVCGSSIPVPRHVGHDRHVYTIREPVGVVAAITPWNAPTMIASWKLAPALAAGCAVVLKPSRDAPLTALHLAGLIEEAGFPPGTVSILAGSGSVAGEALVAHPGVDKVTFTGSPDVGRQIGRACADQFRPVTLELGGKSPQLLFADADLEQSMPTVALSVFANQGEICAAGTRIFAEQSIANEVVSALTEAASSIRVGDPFDESTTMGALISEAHMQSVLEYVDSGVEEGATLIAGGKRLERPGYFVEPTVFMGTNQMRIAREEIFGPVATVIPFDAPRDAVAMANDTRYGLAAVIWTSNVSTAHQTAAKLRAGAVWVNGWGAPDPRLPWGGVKESGLGRDLGRAGVEANTEEKVVTVVL